MDRDVLLSFSLVKQTTMLRDSINLRRLSRATTPALSLEQPSRGDVLRVRNNVEHMRRLADRISRALAEDGENPRACSDEELQEFNRKMQMLEIFVKNHEHIISETPNRVTDSPEIDEDERLLERRRGSIRPDDDEEGKRREPQEQEHQKEKTAQNLRNELFGSHAATSFANFMNEEEGSNVLTKHLERMHEEQEALKEDLTQMVGSLKQRVTGIHSTIERDFTTLDEMSEKTNVQLNSLSKMSSRLGLTLSTSWNNTCRMCAGISFVLAIWVLTYIIMRIFPKAK